MTLHWLRRSIRLSYPPHNVQDTWIRTKDNGIKSAWLKIAVSNVLNRYIDYVLYQLSYVLHI